MSSQQEYNKKSLTHVKAAALSQPQSKEHICSNRGDHHGMWYETENVNKTLKTLPAADEGNGVNRSRFWQSAFVNGTALVSLIIRERHFISVREFYWCDSAKRQKNRLNMVFAQYFDGGGARKGSEDRCVWQSRKQSGKHIMECRDSPTQWCVCVLSMVIAGTDPVAVTLSNYPELNRI